MVEPHRQVGAEGDSAQHPDLQTGEMLERQKQSTDRTADKRIDPLDLRLQLSSMTNSFRLPMEEDKPEPDAYVEDPLECPEKDTRRGSPE